MKSFSSMVLSLAPLLVGCSTHHWAEVSDTQLPPPAAAAVRHTSRVIVALSPDTLEPQCVVYEKHHPVCFFNLRPALERGLARSLWPAFPEVVVGTFADAGPDDYVLQVEVLLDALPPDQTGPGWSAGARGRFRLMRGAHVIAEQTTSSRSRAHFAYGSPLGEGATEVIDATVLHIAEALFSVPESKPDQPALLPRVAAMQFGETVTATPPVEGGTTRANAQAAPSTDATAPPSASFSETTPLAKTEAP